MRPDVTIIIVATNEAELLKNCLLSIQKTQKNLDIELFVVNNASTDQTEFYIKKYATTKHVHIIRNTNIRGFAYNNNLAIKKARADHILLLNPDTELLPEALQTILKFMKRHKTVGIVGPKLLNPDGSLQYSCRRFPTWKTFFVRRTPLRYLFAQSDSNDFHLMKNENHDQERQVDWVLGGCMCIRKKMVDSIGLLDEKYYLYVDDIDYCLRAWRAGWEVWYLPRSRVTHHHRAQSDKKLLSIYSVYHAQSMLRFVLKYGLFQYR